MGNPASKTKDEKPIELLTLNEAAAIVGINPCTLAYFTDKKSIPAIETQDGDLFLKDTVYRWKQGLEIIPNRAIGEKYKGEDKQAVLKQC